MEKDELTRLSYILFPVSTMEERKRARHFLTLSLLISDLGKEETEEILSFISSSTLISISLDDLILFGILEEKDGKYTSTIIEEIGRASCRERV